jgi:HD-GYP domain-containing protein (c-di-GMP phosphodiesterase class II)
MIGEAVLVLCWPELWQDRRKLRPHMRRSRSGAYPLLFLGTDDELAAGAAYALDGPATNSVAALPMAAERLLALVRSHAAAASRVRDMAHRDVELERARYEVELLLSVGRSLSRERDIDSLLYQVLQRAREVTRADAGSVYVVEGDADDVRAHTLRFKVTQNDSVPIESGGFSLPVSSSSIVGTCVLSARSINIPDLYLLGAPGSDGNPWGFVHDRSLDQRHGYQTRSMLTVPMVSAREEVIGVIQLINRRGKGVETLAGAAEFEGSVVPFDEAAVELAEALASQAGIALENALLYDEVKELFEGFVTASVHAIESRDPTTSGHSQRVADLTVELARVVDRTDTGPYASHRFDFDAIREIRYAALLHDFGKVGVRENVLVKAKKLYPHERELLLARFDFIRQAIKVEQLEAKVRYLTEASRGQLAAQLAEVDRDAAARLTELDEFVRFVLAANEPTVLEEGGFERLVEIASRRYRDARGQERPYLSAEEIAALQIPRGSLTQGERLAIEQHVAHTYTFLRQIPWGRSLRNIPEIAGAHHEKLDGSGYPRKRVGDAIPVQARMMTISDIFDALTASDRPYKKAVPLERALAILQAEVIAGKLDAALYALFVDARVFAVVLPGP